MFVAKPSGEVTAADKSTVAGMAGEPGGGKQAARIHLPGTSLRVNGARGFDKATKQLLVWSWCPEPDSNRHGPFRVLGILSPVCLPIPPSGR